MTPRKEVMKETESRTMMQFREQVQEEHEARVLLEAMQKNVNEAHARASKACIRKSRDTCTPLIKDLKTTEYQ